MSYVTEVLGMYGHDPATVAATVADATLDHAVVAARNPSCPAAARTALSADLGDALVAALDSSDGTLELVWHVAVQLLRAPHDDETLWPLAEAIVECHLIAQAIDLAERVAGTAPGVAAELAHWICGAADIDLVGAPGKPDGPVARAVVLIGADGRRRHLVAAPFERLDDLFATGAYVALTEADWELGCARIVAATDVTTDDDPDDGTLATLAQAVRLGRRVAAEAPVAILDRRWAEVGDAITAVADLLDDELNSDDLEGLWMLSGDWGRADGCADEFVARGVEILTYFDAPVLSPSWQRVLARIVTTAGRPHDRGLLVGLALTHGVPGAVGTDALACVLAACGPRNRSSVVSGFVGGVATRLLLRDGEAYEPAGLADAVAAGVVDAGEVADAIDTYLASDDGGPGVSPYGEQSVFLSGAAAGELAAHGSIDAARHLRTLHLPEAVGWLRPEQRSWLVDELEARGPGALEALDPTLRVGQLCAVADAVGT